MYKIIIEIHYMACETEHPADDHEFRVWGHIIQGLRFANKAQRCNQTEQI
jgi:hypothetical protein